jgi:hypothetical protein
MIAKIYSKIGPLYILIKEEEIKNPVDIEKILEKWGYSDLIEIFDGEELVYMYTPNEI